VEHYLEHHRDAHARELDYFRLRRLTDEEAISTAALCELPSQKRHPHQGRIPRQALEESRSRLVGNITALRACESFDELHELVNHVIRPIPMIGPLVVYDTSLRIGARFELEPEVVYLHAGTRQGARRLGLAWRRETLLLDELPPDLQGLSAREAEDVLCIYEDWFTH